MRAVIVTCTVVLFLLVPCAVAGASVLASRRPSAADQLPFTLLGPVGIIAVALGILGLVYGFVRHRRRIGRQAAAARLSAPSPQR
ncbi:MAG: hypothetical protein ACRDRN_03110 [Sciscionella sp.]